MVVNTHGKQEVLSIVSRIGFRKSRNTILAVSASFAAMLAAEGALASYSIVHTFAGPPGDGSAPTATMIFDKAGNLYGTTFNGGTGSNCANSCGTVFKIGTGGKETVLYSFQGGTDGAGPSGKLIRDKAGNLYGTTEFGGNGIGCSACGTIFKLAPDGTNAILNQFVGGTDGAAPTGDLVMDGKGDLFGTTSEGGGSKNAPTGAARPTST